MSATIGLPCSSSGTIGSDGANRRLAIMPSSSGAFAMNSRRNRRTSGAWFMFQATMPASTVGPKGLEFEGEVSDDAEVAAPTPQRPEELWVLLFAGHDEVAVGGDHITGTEPID